MDTYSVIIEREGERKRERRERERVQHCVIAICDHDTRDDRNDKM